MNRVPEHSHRKLVLSPVSARLVLGWLLAVACLGGGLGCDKPTTQLLEIQDVTRDDDARSLSVIGAGFPGARSGDAELSGTLYQPGTAPRRVHHVLPCRALSSELLRVELHEDGEDLMGQGLFEGRLDIHFPSNEGSSEVVGSVPSVRIRFEDGRKADLSSTVSLTRRARAFQRELGALEVESSARGLLLVNVAQDSLLAQAGVEAGDRIQRIDGAPVERAQDLVPVDERAEHTLELSRRLGGRSDTVRLVRPGQTKTPLSALASIAFIVSVLGGLLVPAAARSARETTARSTHLAGIALTGAAFLVFGAARGALDVRLFYGLPLTIALGLWGFAFAKRQVSGVQAVEAILTWSASTLALAGLAILSGSLTNEWSGLSDSASPLHWTLLSAPPAWLALFVLNSARTAQPSFAYGSEVHAWLRFTTAASIVSLSLGSGQLPHGSLAWLASQPVALVFFAGKTALVASVLSHHPLTLPRTLVGALSLLCPLSAWLWLSFAPRPEIALVLGCVGLGVTLTRVGLRHMQARRPGVRDPALAPFL